MLSTEDEDVQVKHRTLETNDSTAAVDDRTIIDGCHWLEDCWRSLIDARANDNTTRL